MLNSLTHYSTIRSSNIWSMCEDDSLCVETILNLFKISDIMSCLNIGISIQVIITKFYAKYYLLVLHTSICVITNSLLNIWAIHLINDFVTRKTLHVSNDSKSQDWMTSSIWSFRMRFVLMWLSHLCYYNNGIIIT